MNRSTVIPAKREHSKGLLESDNSSEDKSLNSAIGERSSTTIVGRGDVELSVIKPEGKEYSNNGDAVTVKGIRRHDYYNPLPPHEQYTETTRSNNKAVQREVSLFDFALSFHPKGEEWRSQRSDTPESIHALFYGNLAQSNEEATRISERVQLNIERSIIVSSGSQQL